jgi:hypothetical protein
MQDGGHDAVTLVATHFGVDGMTDEFPFPLGVLAGCLRVARG